MDSTFGTNKSVRYFGGKQDFRKLILNLFKNKCTQFNLGITLIFNQKLSESFFFFNLKE